MQAAEAARDLVTTCQLANTAINAAMTARIALACMTPTGRDLERLSTLAPEMRERIIEVEGIAGLSEDEVRSLHHYAWEVRTKQVQLPGRLGLLAEYFEQKTNWMIENGLHTEAAHWFWGPMVDIDRYGFASPQAKQAAIRACEQWFLQIGWNVENVQSKVRGVREILREAETAYSVLDATGDK